MLCHYIQRLAYPLSMNFTEDCVCGLCVAVLSSAVFNTSAWKASNIK